MKLIILCVLIVACFGRVKFQDTKSVLAELDQDKFGSTMLSALQMNLAAESPVEEIVLLIQEILNQVQTDQDNADEKNRTDQAVCDQTLSSLRQQIIETKNTISSTEGAINENELINSQAKKDLAQADADYDETVQSINTGTEIRSTEHAKWIEEDYQNQIDIATLEEGVKLINHMIHGVAFSQIKQRYDKVIEKLSDNSAKHTTMFKPMISSLTQLATKLNFDNVMKILDLLNNIRVSIVEEKEKARLSETKSQEDWETLLSHLTQEKQRLSDKRARLRALIEATTTLLAQLNTSLENNKVQLENLQAAFSSQDTWCNEQSAVYASESDERQRELTILAKLLTSVQEKMASVAEYVAGRTGPSF